MSVISIKWQSKLAMPAVGGADVMGADVIRWITYPSELLNGADKKRLVHALALDVRSI